MGGEGSIRDSRWGKVGVVAAIVGVLLAAVALYVQTRPDDDPNFGSPSEPIDIDSADNVREFLLFLDEHENTKVFLNVYSPASGEPELRRPKDTMRAAGLLLRNAPEPDASLQLISVARDTSEGSTPVYGVGYSSAYGWSIRGYFSVVGTVSVRMDVRIRQLVPINYADATG